MVGAQSYVTHTHTYCLMALVGQCSGLENTVVGAQSYVTHTHILSHGFSWAMFRIGEHCGRGTELCHTYTHIVSWL